ncbi:antitoxin Xre/MbcA/ParS toxin-binding domain-containing protein [Stenotrophomonas indicatrix]|uniref:antitoxin Xre/MbcA/ParS toxin-binding domain-containing protein n=1 Tax=Stenotrophomonas indicatrix TaxID=2045451 RepID=UPI003CE53C60
MEQTGIAEELWPETLERVSYAIGIYRTLHSIFPDRQQADTWIRRPNSAELFNGAPALVLMCSGRIGDLASVRKYLETAALGSP